MSKQLTATQHAWLVSILMLLAGMELDVQNLVANMENVAVTVGPINNPGGTGIISGGSIHVTPAQGAPFTSSNLAEIVERCGVNRMRQPRGGKPRASASIFFDATGRSIDSSSITMRVGTCLVIQPAHA